MNVQIKHLKKNLSRNKELNINPKANESHVAIQISQQATMQNIKNILGQELKLNSNYITLYWPGSPSIDSISVFDFGRIQDNKLLNKANNELHFKINYDTLENDLYEKAKTNMAIA